MTDGPPPNYLVLGSERPEPFWTFRDTPHGHVLYTECQRPVLYGIPADLEATSLHDAHRVLASRLPDWTFEDTRALWRDVARDLFDAEWFRGEEELHQRFYYWRWNDREDEAWDQVVGAARRLWARTPRALRDPARARDPEQREGLRLAAHLLDNPRLFDNPRDCEFNLINLVSLASLPEHAGRAAWTLFERAHQREWRRVGADQIRGFCDIGTGEEWNARRIRPYPEFTSYDRVVQGITEVVWRMSALVTGEPRPS